LAPDSKFCTISVEKIIELSKKKSELLGYEKHPYDALLDEYEEDLTTEMVESYFEKIMLISHNPLISNWGESKIIVEKKNNISKLLV
jgi:Zn-dependent M32 family carboxypeptidase